MKPVMQTTFGFPGGNCFSACVASLLHLPIEDVPYFMGADDKWWDMFLAWLEPRGYYAICFPLRADQALPGYYVLSGRSPRGTADADLHSVVARGLKIVHDPSPEPRRGELLSREDAIVLVPLDPRQCITEESL